MVFVYTGKGRRGAQKDDAPPEQKLCAKQGEQNLINKFILLYDNGTIGYYILSMMPSHWIPIGNMKVLLCL